MREVLTVLILSILMMIGAYTEYSWYMLVAISVTGLLLVATCINLVLKYHVPKHEEKE